MNQARNLLFAALLLASAAAQAGNATWSLNPIRQASGIRLANWTPELVSPEPIGRRHVLTASDTTEITVSQDER